jgi:hypothetical protein
MRPYDVDQPLPDGYKMSWKPCTDMLKEEPFSTWLEQWS